MADRLFLIGMMASGKTTVGRQVAQRLGWGYLDSDDQVEARTGRTVKQIFEEDGEAAFRAEERAALEAAIADGRSVVVGVAGGAVLDPANRELLRRTGGTVAWLRAEPETLIERIRKSGQGHRPLLRDDPEGTLRRLDAERRPLYQELADVIVDVDGRSTGEIVEHLVLHLRATTT